MSGLRGGNLLPFLAAAAATIVVVCGLWFLRAELEVRDAARLELGNEVAPEAQHLPENVSKDAKPHAPRRSDAPGRDVSDKPTGDPAASPVRTAPPGAELTRLPEPPERSLIAFSAERYEAGLSAEVSFEPYGIGPDSFGRSIVAAVSASTPHDPAASFPDLVGRNVVFLIEGHDIEQGGGYVAQATTRLDGDRIVLVLSNIRPVGFP